jgi:hypothetical protein
MVPSDREYPVGGQRQAGFPTCRRILEAFHCDRLMNPEA